MKFHFIIVFLLLLTFDVLSQAPIGLPMVKNFSPEMYNGGIQNWEIIQDSRGVIYVANNFGLLQYDGNTWRNYPVSGATKLRSISLGENGKIYAGLQGDFGYYAPDSVGTFQYHSIKKLLPEKYNIDETWKTYVLDNKVYFCTFLNIFVYDGKKIDVITNNQPLDVSYKSGNKIYTQVRGKGLHVVRNNEIEPVPNGETFANKTISGIVTKSTNHLLLATSRNGMFLSNKSTITPWEIPLNNTLKETFINYITLLKNGQIAIGTQHSGVYIIDEQGDIKLHLNKDKGLHNRTILSLFEDVNNNLWIGQNNGISFAKLKSPFLLINEEAGLHGTGYTAYGRNGYLYLGTNNGTYLQQNNTLQMIEGSEGQVYSINEVQQELLMGHHNGSFIIKDNKAELIAAGIGTWTFTEFNNQIVKGTYNGIEILDNELNYVGRINSLNESSRVLVKENDTTLWMAHGYKGLYKISPTNKTIENAKISFYNKDHGLPGNLYNDVVWINGTLKFITVDGIYSYSHHTDKFIKDEALSTYFEGEQIIAIKNDIFKNIYFITDKNIGFLEKLTGKGFIKHANPFNSIRNLLNDDLPNINIVAPNLVLFGAREGFVVFDRNLFWTTDNETFSTLIRNVKSTGAKEQLLYNGEIVQQKGEISKVPYSNNSINFEFACLSFSTTIPTEFQYKLDGFDNDWSEWTSTNFKEYTNLREGNYSFIVRSRNSNGQLSEPINYLFTVLPPWYRTKLAYSGYLSFTIFSLVGLVMFINQRHSREKAILERKRLKQLSEKDQQLDSITKQTENKINKLKNEKLESEIKHMNTELASNTMHLLNKNQFINSIKSTLEGVEKKSKNNEVKSQIKRVIKDIGKNIETDGDWEHFQIHFDKVHGNFSSRIKKDYPGLTPQEIKLSAYLRLNLSTKEIANLLNISVRGVEIARYRLRKKLSLDRSQNLTEFILNY